MHFKPRDARLRRVVEAALFVLLCLVIGAAIVVTRPRLLSGIDDTFGMPGRSAGVASTDVAAVKPTTDVAAVKPTFDTSYPAPMMPTSLPLLVPQSFPQPDDPFRPTPAAPYPIPSTPTPTLPLPTAQPTPGPNEPYQMGIEDLMPDLSVAEWTRRANVVLIGTVVDMLPPRWSTPDGLRPANPFSASYTIYTPIRVQVHQQLKGDSRQPTVLLFVIGGQIGQDSVTYSSSISTYQMGDRVVLFLSPDRRSLDGEPLWQIRERFIITADNMVLKGNKKIPLQEVIAEVRASSQ